MAKQLIRPANGPAPGGAYSPGLRVGDFIFVSGQGPLDPATGQHLTTAYRNRRRGSRDIKRKSKQTLCAPLHGFRRDSFAVESASEFPS